VEVPAAPGVAHAPVEVLLEVSNFLLAHSLMLVLAELFNLFLLHLGKGVGRSHGEKGPRHESDQDSQCEFFILSPPEWFKGGHAGCGSKPNHSRAAITPSTLKGGHSAARCLKVQFLRALFQKIPAGCRLA